MQRKLPFSADPIHRTQRPTKARLRPLSHLWVNGELRLHFELLTEETKAGEGARGENLNMDVIHLDYGEHAHQISQLCDLLRAAGDEVNGETKQVLTLWVTPDGTICKIVPPPTCKFADVGSLDDHYEPLEELDVDGEEIFD